MVKKAEQEELTLLAILLRKEVQRIDKIIKYVDSKVVMNLIQASNHISQAAYSAQQAGL
jgi:hypothetical protein